MRVAKENACARRVEKRPKSLRDMMPLNLEMSGNGRRFNN